MKINHTKLDTLVGNLLDDYREDKVQKNSVTYLIGHLVEAAAKGNEGEVKSWTENPDMYAEWLTKAMSEYKA